MLVSWASYIDPLRSWHLSGCFLSSHGWRVTLCPVTLILIYCVYCMVLPQPLLRRWYRCCQLSHLIERYAERFNNKEPACVTRRQHFYTDMTDVCKRMSSQSEVWYTVQHVWLLIFSCLATLKLLSYKIIIV